MFKFALERSKENELLELGGFWLHKKKQKIERKINAGAYSRIDSMSHACGLIDWA